MAELRSHVPELLARLGWDNRTFAARCMLNGVGQDTAYRMARGETNFYTDTVRKVAEILGVPSIADVIDMEHDNPNQRQ